LELHRPLCGEPLSKLLSQRESNEALQLMLMGADNYDGTLVARAEFSAAIIEAAALGQP